MIFLLIALKVPGLFPKAENRTFLTEHLVVG